MKKNMRPVVVKSKLLDPSPKNDFVNRKQPVCPKPVRPVSPTVPDVLRPLRCSKHRKNVIFNLIDSSSVNASGHDRKEESACSACSAPYYSGSPPGRTNNPLIYDAHFVHQMEMLSPFSCQN